MQRLAVISVGLLLAAVAAATPAKYVSSPPRAAVAAKIEKDGSLRVLSARGADLEVYPASITKLMTALLVFDDIKAGRYALDDIIETNYEVSRCEPSCIGLKPGSKMSCRQLLLSMLVKSANDAAIALAVKSAGSHAAFVERMNKRAEKLGMKSTRYYNANGLQAPKWAKQNNVSTASDLLRLGKELILRYPQILNFTSVKVGEVIDETGKSIKFINHNNVMVKDKYKVVNPDGSEAVDGLKTGYIAAGGSSVLMSAKRGNARVLVAVLGANGQKERDALARTLLIDALSSQDW